MKISVIIPSYKPGEYIYDCLDSLKRQDFPATDCEILVVLNGCCEPYRTCVQNHIAEQHIGNAVILQTDKGGVSNARNIGLDNAKGEYIPFVDDDDWLSSNYLSNLMKQASENAVVCSNFMLIEEDNNLPQPYFLSDAYRRCCGLPSLNLFNGRRFLSPAVGKLIHTGIIGNRRFSTVHKLGEDSFFMFCISDRIKGIRLAPANTVYYVRAREKSASRKHYTYSERIGVAASLTKSYFAQIIKHPFAYNLPLWASRVMATIIKLRKKEYI